MSTQEKNEALMLAVETYDVAAVKKCLENGSDPNYQRVMEPDLTDGRMQPSTPLRMVMFRISDSLLGDNELEAFAVIAKLLLEYGADPKPAMKIAAHRYGQFDPAFEDSPFVKVWRIVADATRK